MTHQGSSNFPTPSTACEEVSPRKAVVAIHSAGWPRNWLNRTCKSFCMSKAKPADICRRVFLDKPHSLLADTALKRLRNLLNVQTPLAAWAALCLKGLLPLLHHLEHPLLGPQAPKLLKPQTPYKYPRPPQVLESWNPLKLEKGCHGP